MLATEGAIHRFEAAGLGAAPFRFVCVRENVFVACPGASPKAGGTCAYCCQGIRYEYVVKSSDGKTFTVGCDCVAKTGDAGLQKRVDQERRRIETAARHAKEDARIAQGVEQIEANRPALAALPHPFAMQAARGKTLADYVDWMLGNAGRSGKLSAVRLALKALAPTPCGGPPA